MSTAERSMKRIKKEITGAAYLVLCPETVVHFQRAAMPGGLKSWQQGLPSADDGHGNARKIGAER